MLTLTSCTHADPDPNSRLGLITEWAERNPNNANAIDMLWMAGLVRELSALTGELAGDLEAYVDAHYGGPDVHQAVRNQYDAAMAIVREARAAIARAGR